MKMLHDHALGVAPNVYMLLRPTLTDFPAIFNVTGDSVVGNGAGFQDTAIYSSYGEYIERYHFYYEVDMPCLTRLDQVNCEQINNKIKKVIQQTKKTKQSIDLHQFTCTETYNVFTKQSVWLPSIMISLGDFQSQIECLFHLPIVVGRLVM